MTVTIKVIFNDGRKEKFTLNNYFPGQAAKFIHSLENVKKWQLCF